LSNLLTVIGQPARIQILVVLGEQEACVCHLESALGMRQPSISQHLMVLRKAGLVTAQREGRNIFYRMAKPELVNILYQTAALINIDASLLSNLTQRPMPGCSCPQCNPDLDPAKTCAKSKPAHTF